MSEPSGSKPGSTDDAFAATDVSSPDTTTVATAISAGARRPASLVHSDATVAELEAGSAGGSLEDAYLQLTAGAVQFRGGAR